MNIQTFLYNENFYKKLALAVSIIRLTPSHLTTKEYTIQLQNILRRQKLQSKQILIDLHSLRKLNSRKIFDLLEYYKNFLGNIQIEDNIEIQTMIIETIERIFQLFNEHFLLIKQSKYQILFQQIIDIILNYDIITNIQKHLIEHIKRFIDVVLIYTKQENITTNAQMFLEQIVFQRILDELFIYFDTSNSNTNYGLILLNILQKLVQINDKTILEQILNNDIVRQRFHDVLYICLIGNNNDISFIIHLWNIYGRIV